MNSLVISILSSWIIYETECDWYRVSRNDTQKKYFSGTCSYFLYFSKSLKVAESQSIKIFDPEGALNTIGF